MAKEYMSKGEYINLLSNVVSVRHDVIGLEYHKNQKGEEFMFLKLMTGFTAYFDITGLKEDEIFHILAQIDCKIAPTHQVKDPAKRLEIGKMFY